MLYKKMFLTISCAISLLQLQAQEPYVLVQNKNGATLGYSPQSGVQILTVKGLKFKDLNKNGRLDRYEDWRLPAEERAEDLAGKMSLEQIAGLMLYSRHQAVPSLPGGYFGGTYNGRGFPESGASAWDLTDQQKQFLKNDNLRHVLLTSVQSPETAARWNNAEQAYVEGLGLGIPANNSSDPRHTAKATTEFNAGAGGTISLWPDGLAMAATFDPDVTRQFGEMASREYRALGIATALSPQTDLGTEPRWYRITGTFGESPELDRDMTIAYIDGFQTSAGKEEIKNGWGYKSVNAMVKHWPGGGPEEGGRDAHWAYGKFAVYPGANLADHLKPFIDGAFKLKGKTGKASAVMPYYTISYGIDSVYGENVGNNFSKYILTDLLRKKYNYDGVICTDWLVTADEGKHRISLPASPGVEQLTVMERHYKALMAGVDQFGGNNEQQPVIEAYYKGVKEHGEKFMRQRFELSARRLLLNIFRTGLFENPYLDPAESKSIVGNPVFMKAGYDAQLKSVVLLKNHDNILPLRPFKTVYIPKIYYPARKNFFGMLEAPRYEYPIDTNLVKKYYLLTEDPAKADFALVFISGPQSKDGGYSQTDRKNGGNGYVPVPLQYGTYTATEAREQSMAAGDPVIDPEVKNRSYKNKTTTAYNTMDLQTVLDTKAMMGNKPVVVSVTASGPMIFREFEKETDGILLNFGVSLQAVLDIVSGNYEPSALLPVQMPADMRTVELQKEDVPFDMQCYKDMDGRTYDFGFGLNWKGPIRDSRTKQYNRNATVSR
ncbi:glycoside hydrolase family 3 protein [Niabella sp. W65]|nr:glycoside hydrolase family 3 protein [Niabella sp. W65]MCH7362929.1 glycoside hydrolase family 3 protein [Niabella sp. W65]